MPADNITIPAYDQNYFEALETQVSYKGGYQNYGATFQNRNRCNAFVPVEESKGYYEDIATMLRADHFLDGKKVLEIGCAYGYIVHYLRGLGVNAYGIDVSAWAVQKAHEMFPELAETDVNGIQYVSQADARTHLSTYGKREFYFVFSRWVLQCFTDLELLGDGSKENPGIIEELNTISSYQGHFIYTRLPDVYNVKTLQEWLALPWDRGTRLVEQDSVLSGVLK